MKRVTRPGEYGMPFKDCITIAGKTLYIGGINLEAGRTTDPAKADKNNPAPDQKNFNAIPDMIIRSDKDGKVMDIEMGNERNGMVREHMVGRFLHELFPDEIAILHMDQLEKVLATRSSAAYTYALQTDSGQPGHYEVRAIRSNDNEVIFIIRDTTAKKNERLSLVRGIIEGEEKERKRVAQELHDGLGQIMSALYMQVGTLSKKPDIGPLLQGPMKMIADIISEYRAISHNLMPPVLEDFDLPAVLKTLCDRVNEAGKCHASFHNIKFRSKPEKYVVRELYRISQEVINNAIKHADCDVIELSLDETNTHIRITIADNGKGFDVSEIKKKTNGIGLKNIFTRTELIGGNVEFSSSKDNGTMVSLSVPKPVVKGSTVKKNISGFKS